MLKSNKLPNNLVLGVAAFLALLPVGASAPTLNTQNLQWPDIVSESKLREALISDRSID